MENETSAEERTEGAEGTENANTQEVKTFTQEELDAIIQRRLEKYKDHDKIKQELDTLRNEKEEGAWKNEVRDEIRTDVTKSANQRVLEAEARAFATAANFVYPEDAVRFIEESNLEYDEDGFLKPSSVEDQIKKLVEERPALVRSKNTATASDVGLGTGGTRKPLNGREAFLGVVSR